MGSGTAANALTPPEHKAAAPSARLMDSAARLAIGASVRPPSVRALLSARSTLILMKGLDAPPKIVYGTCARTIYVSCMYSISDVFRACTARTNVVELCEHRFRGNAAVVNQASVCLIGKAGMRARSRAFSIDHALWRACQVPSVKCQFVLIVTRPDACGRLTSQFRRRLIKALCLSTERDMS